MCRPLTAPELKAARLLNLVVGWDVDDETKCPEQRFHLVEGDAHENMRPVCGAETLWGYANEIKHDDAITCPRCLEMLPTIIRRANRALNVAPVRESHPEVLRRRAPRRGRSD